MHQTRVGGIIPGAERRGMVSGGEEIQHKCAGIKSSQTGNTFYHNKEKGVSINMRIDNMVIVSFLMKMGRGGTNIRSFFYISKEIRDHNILREIMITAEYLPGVLSKEVDKESTSLKD